MDWRNYLGFFPNDLEPVGREGEMSAWAASTYARRCRLLDAGENSLAGLDLPTLGYECTGSTAGGRADHVLVGRR